MEAPTIHGHPDYARMLSDLGIEPPIRPGAIPVFRTRGEYPELFRVIETGEESGIIRIDHFDGGPTEAYLDELWLAYQRDEIERVSTAHLADHQVVIDRTTLAVIVDHAAVEADELDGWTLRGAPPELNDAIETAREVLDG